MPLPLLVPLWLASAAPAPSSISSGEVDAVELPWSRYQALREADRDREAPAPGPWVADREIELRPVEGGWELRGRWTIEAQAPGWLWQPVLGTRTELVSIRFAGASVPVVPLPGGKRMALFVERSGTLEVRAFVPGSIDERLDLQLLPATRGRLTVDAPGRVPVPLGEPGREAPPVLTGGVLWSGASRLSLELRDPDRAPPTHETLAVAHAGVGLTVGDAEVRGRAHLQWELRHGSLDQVRVRTAGLGDDLEVEGPNVATWSRRGDTLEVKLAAPAVGRVDLDLRWSTAVPAGEEASLGLPELEPEAWRTESALQIARDGEIEVIPRADAWTAITAADLPQWGQGLVEGTPTAAYQRGGAPGEGQLDLLRFVPVPGPPTVIDVASYTLATTEEGRVLMRAHYELRNDRGAHLRVTPPPGLTIIGARVAGETALPSRDDEGAWRIPLKRSLETVEGLLSFPVEVILMGEQEQWDRREKRELPLPTLDVPVAASRVTLHLPPRYRSRLETGEHNVVGEFAEGEGLAYGLGVGQVGSATADALFQEAVQGYLSNDFESAQTKLEQLEQLGVDNENMARLQSNINVIEGKADAKDKGDLTMQRRVKEQARARAVGQFRQQEVLIEEAKKSAQAGDYAEAESRYKAALDLGGELEKLEQSESIEQAARNADLEVELKTISKKKGKRGKLAGNKNAEKRPPIVAEASASRPASTPAPQGRIDASRLLDPQQGPSVDTLDGGLQTTFANHDDDGRAAAGTSAGADGGPTNGTTEGVTVEETTGREAPAAKPAAPPRDEDLQPTILSEQGARPEDEPDEADWDDELEPAREQSERGVLADAPAVRLQLRGLGGRIRSRVRDRRSRRERRGAAKQSRAVDDALAVYDFEDDDVEGGILRPEGANIASRARATSSSPSNDPLPRPEVTASALSVVIPATGQAVRYEQLLIEADQTQTITIDARRRLRR